MSPSQGGEQGTPEDARESEKAVQRRRTEFGAVAGKPGSSATFPTTEEKPKHTYCAGRWFRHVFLMPLRDMGETDERYQKAPRFTVSAA